MMNMRNGQTEKKSVVRPATQANLFYTGDARELREEVDSFLALNRGRTIFNNVAAVIVPHAGYYFSGNVAAAAYMSIPQEKKYKRIFLLGPSHHEWLDGASVNTDADYYARRCSCRSCKGGLERIPCLPSCRLSSLQTISRS